VPRHDHAVWILNVAEVAEQLVQEVAEQLVQLVQLV
jgi:hypothetical protein